MKNKWIIIGLIVFISSCSTNEKKSDAYGNFEATETTVSSEVSGKIIFLTIEEGNGLEANQRIGLIDTIQLSLKREQLIAQRKGISSKSSNVLAQINVLNEQKSNSMVEKKRIEKLFKDGAATQKQLDEINGVMGVYDKQILSIQTQNAPILDELESYTKQIEQLNDQIKRCSILNPFKGTVLTKYSQANEVVVPGKALYKLANLDEMYLRVYVSGAILPKIKLGQKVEVKVDQDADNNKTYQGEISYISSNAEFTPKIIQTKEERVNLVYAVKVRVKNDGTLKIGMPGEVNFK